MKKKFVGYYNPSVILTYVGLASACLSMYLSYHGIFRWGFFFMMFAGLCDMFDGTVARKIKRNDSEKKFGIQIDSLCDLVCFGVNPAVTGILLYGGRETKIIGFFAGLCLILGAVIRLAFFNVTEEERQQQTTERRKFYQGLPVTNSCLIAPLGYIIGSLISKEDALPYVYSGFLFLTAFLFIFNFKMPKPHGKFNIVIIILAWCLFFGVLAV